jgi:hypothetical protein
MITRVHRRVRIGAAAALCWAAALGLGGRTVAAEVPPAGKPPTAYQIRLGPRQAQASPDRTGGGQTGGGYIDVEQPAPNALVVIMRGAAVAGSDCKHTAAASIAFELDQEFTVVPTREGLRPPKLGLAARVVGTLDTSDKKKGGGTADQGEACAAVLAGETNLLHLCVPPQSAAGGQKTFLNNRAGPVDVTAVPACYRLHQTFRIAASQCDGLCGQSASAADFDPNPQLDPRWNDALKTFRAVPKTDFGFRVVLWVIEEPPAAGPPAEVEPAPAPAKAAPAKLPPLPERPKAEPPRPPATLPDK